MMKLKNTRNLDARQSMLLDNAYYAVRPPERMGLRRKRRPPAQEYMRHLVLDTLTAAELKPVRFLPSTLLSHTRSHGSVKQC
jgi:regulator of nonsense transcripts 2